VHLIGVENHPAAASANIAGLRSTTRWRAALHHEPHNPQFLTISCPNFNSKELFVICALLQQSRGGMDQLLRRFYKSGLYPLLRRINTYLVRWAKRKYKRLRGHTKRAQRWLVRIARRQPTLFAHWRLARPDGWTMGAE
jgi:hypothetical protein